MPYEERSLTISDILWVAREVIRVLEGQFLQPKSSTANHPLCQDEEWGTAHIGFVEERGR